LALTRPIVLFEARAMTEDMPNDCDEMMVMPAATLCLDGRSETLPEGTGVSRYAQNLAGALADAGRLTGRLRAVGRESRLQRWLHAAAPGSAFAACDAWPATWTAQEVFRRAQVHFNLHGRPLRVASPMPPDVMHWTYPVPLRFVGARNVYTIHDLVPLTHPALTSVDRSRYRRILRALTATADHIVTVSEHTRRQVISLLGVPPDSVTSTSQTVALPSETATGGTGESGGEYFLFCGSIEPRKNLTRLIQAHQASGTSVPLVLAGPDGWRAQEVLSAAGVAIHPLAARRPEDRGGVWRAPWLARDEQIRLLRGARALLFPSLAEGFGLPIAEAMTLGVPVMTSSGGGTEETAGEAALLVDPLDVSEMAQAVALLASNNELHAALSAAGRRRAALFAPAPYAERVLAVYDRVLRPVG
jgi:glycosyltransferase involved in cell wall biosynthesis